jgi:hypothetical protein
MAPRRAGDRCRVVSSTSDGGAQRWGLLYAEQRQPQGQRTVETQGRQQSAQAGRTCKRLCRTAFACEAAAQQALTRFAADWQTTVRHDRLVCPPFHSGQRRRPGPETPPAQMVYPIPGALASQFTAHRARVDQPRWCILATNARDEAQ